MASPRPPTRTPAAAPTHLAGLALVLATLLPGPAPTADATEVSFQFHTVGAIGQSPSSIDGGDIDGDGDQDLVAVADLNDELAWYQSDGATPPQFTTHKVLDYLQAPYSTDSPFSVAAADLDGDQDLDFVVGGADKIAWYQNQGGPDPEFLIASTTTVATVPGVWQLRTADLDGDHDVDILSAHPSDDRVAWYENQGNVPPTFVEHIIVDSTSGSDRAAEARSVFAADLDGDGDLDALSASSADGKVAWYENDGGSPPSFTPHVITSSLPDAYFVVAGDLDGDSDIDVVSASFSNNTVAWYENNGAQPPSFTSHVISTAYEGPFRLAIADLDRDGRPDVLAGLIRAVGTPFVWFENLGGTPPAWSAHEVQVDFLYAGDVDGDLDTDLVSGSHAPDIVYWYENLLPPPPIPALGLAGAGAFLLLAGASVLLRRLLRRTQPQRPEA
jgi:hypothetical protein